MLTGILAEAKRLYDLGWAVHWLQPKSKVPVKKGWGSGPRDNWRTVEKDYRQGFGLGVRVGDPSALEQGGYLANVDVDVKSGEDRHTAEALALVEKLFPGAYAAAPVIKTGYGLRLLVRTAEPLDSRKLGQSTEECKAFMPSTPVNRRQQQMVEAGKLTSAELEEGFRIRPAWEVELMSRGRQVVLPPSVHPETGKPYTWQRPLGKKALPLIVVDLAGERQAEYTTNSSADRNKNFTPVAVDLVFSSLSDKFVNLILRGDGIDKYAGDRSAACQAASLAMVRAGFTDDEILTVLTDKTTFLGETAWEHASNNGQFRVGRGDAARWAYRYGSVEKARAAADPRAVFGDPDTQPEAPQLSEAAAAAQAAELTYESWEVQLKRGTPSKGNPNPAPLPTLQNTVLVLENELGEALFRRNELTTYDHYGTSAPWPTAKVGGWVTDDCVSHMKLFIGQRHNFEPPKDTLEDAIRVIATRNGYHPVKDELAALPPWDGVPRLDTWLIDNFGARIPDDLLEDSPELKSRDAGKEYLAQVFRKWLVASITRTFRPGEQFDWMPIFQGKQGRGKSSIGKILFGKAYHNDRLPKDLNDKDAAIALEGMRVAEWGELSNLTRGELDEVKGFITRTSDRIRKPYGRRLEDRPRQIVYYGTTDKPVYLRDEAGNRRFNPIEITGWLDFKKLEREREQLWAEALFIYENGLEEFLFMQGDAAEVAELVQKSKMIPDESAFYIDTLRTWLDADVAERDLSAFKLEPLFLATGPLFGEKKSVHQQRMVAKALRLLGAEMYPKKGTHWWRYPAKKDS